MGPASLPGASKEMRPQNSWVAGCCFQSCVPRRPETPQGEGWKGAEHLLLTPCRLGCRGPTTAQGGGCRQEAVGVYKVRLFLK